MGRQTRQTRRAQQRREQQKGTHAHQERNWAVGGGVAVVVAAVVLLLAFTVFRPSGTNSAAAPTPVPTISAGPSAANIGCNQGMGVGYHIHAHISLINKGKVVTIPSDFGHDYTHDCLFWLHAHADENGVIHLESPTVMHPTLAQYQAVARRTLPAKDVVSFTPPAGDSMRVWVNQKPYSGNPESIRIYNHENIVVEYGPPFIPPPAFDWNAPAVKGL
ncbi:MAG: hypothetical protein ACR2GA_06835 [Chloroflexota bacterium]